MTNIKKINIGITVGITSKEESLWTNGIKMNAIFLLRTLQMSPKKYNVYLVNTNKEIDVNDPEVKLPWDSNMYPIYQYNKIAHITDLLIMLGTSFDEDSIKAFKEQHDKNSKIKAKVIGYRCGNNYVIDTERSIFKKGEDAPKPAWSGNLDDVWFVPQQERHNKHLYDFMENVDSKPVPFVWSPEFLDQYVYNILNKKPNLVKGAAKNVYLPRNKKRITCFEPNINVLKFALIPTIAVEESYKENKDVIERYVICSGNNIGVNKTFVNTISKFKIVKDKILKVDGRYPMPHYLISSTDIVVSHQWDNPLNYAYLDAMYMGYPIIHNAPMVQDGGYYYYDFNIKEAGKMLTEAIRNHDSNIEKYNNKSEIVYKRYMPEYNTEIVALYDMLIENLWNPDKNKLSYQYNWKNNLYK